MNAVVYVHIDQGIHKGKMNVALNEKRKKLRGFSFSINIANFEAFLLVFKLTKNPLFLKSDVVVHSSIHDLHNDKDQKTHQKSSNVIPAES